MKKYILAAVLTLSAPVMASIESCTKLSSFAETAMQIRQDGTSLSVVLNALNEGEPTRKDNATNWIILEAYKQPLFATEKYKKQAVNRFGNDVMLRCMK